MKNTILLKRYKFYEKIHIKCYFVKLQSHFYQNLLFIGCGLFPQVTVIYLNLIKHVPLGFNTLVVPPVWIVRDKLWKVVIKRKTVMLLSFVYVLKKITFLRLWHFISSHSDPNNPIFVVVVWICKIKFFEVAFFLVGRIAIITEELLFFCFHGNHC